MANMTVVKYCLLISLLFPACSPGQLIAFGDSITVGYMLPSASDAYISKVAAAKHWILARNFAVIGSEAPDQADYIYATSTGAGNIFTYMIGTNDFNDYTVDPNPARLTYFQDADADELAWLALPSSAKVLGTSSAVSYAGNWATTSAIGPGYGIGSISTTNGDSATFQVAGTSIYVGTLVQNGNGGEFSLTVDGVPRGSYHCYSDIPIHTLSDREYAPKLIRFSGLQPGPHTVTMTTTSATSVSNRVYLDWAAGNDGVSSRNAPLVYTAGVPRPAGDYLVYYWLYSSIVAANVQALAADGMQIKFVDVAAYMEPATDLIDSVHPNPTGSTHIANAFLNAINQGPPVLGAPQVADAGIRNGFSFLFGPATPGSLMTIFGSNLGPDTGVVANFDSSLTLPRSLGGVTVTFDGFAAPMMYVSGNQINLQIPYEVASQQPDMDMVISRNGLSTQMKVSGGVASPGVWPALFSSSGAILDSLGNPARPGDVITIFATGTGVTTPAALTGAAIGSSNVAPTLPISIYVGGIQAQMVSDASTIDAVGQLQLSFKIPSGLALGPQPIVVLVNGIPSQQGVAVNVGR